MAKLAKGTVLHSTLNPINLDVKQIRPDQINLLLLGFAGCILGPAGKKIKSGQRLRCKSTPR